MSHSSLGSWNNGVAVTPADGTVFTPPLGGIWVGGAGNVAVRMYENQQVLTFTGVLAGTWLNVKVDKVMGTNTTATNIVGVF